MWLLLLGCRGLTVNDVTTGESEAYPELQSLYPTVDPATAMRRVEAVAAEMPGWHGCDSPEPFVLHCEATTPSGRWTDDVWIFVARHGPKVTQVKVRSASREGKGDFGANAERILAFQDAYLSTSPGSE
jgi:uncharacterized protein (DUF1499 family)